MQERTIGRYRELGQLGRGGVARVFEVCDLRSGEHLALKKLEPVAAGERERVHRLFEREYHVLTQLSHPQVVAVRDYDVDVDGTPFYTMELLRGQTLRAVSPLPVERVCEILLDLCSALSLLHSRKLVHRDITPSNVHCHEHGHTKLLDFGAARPFGPDPQLVGTPGYCAPEMLSGEPLDARTDLFALGATAYFALTGRQPYPAANFRELRDAWARPVVPAAQLVSEVPAALDGLLLSMLRLDRGARPASAAAVMGQLSALLGRDKPEAARVPQAYLTTPTLVGRGHEVTRIKALVAATAGGAARALLITGAPGIGRSRVLSSAVLEAKLQGLSVVLTDARASAGDLGLSRQLAIGLLRQAPRAFQLLSDAEQAALAQLLGPQGRRLGVIAHGAELDPVGVPTSGAQRRRIRSAWIALVTGAARARPLLLAVDDVDLADEPSIALLALLARLPDAGPIAIVATSEPLLRPARPTSIHPHPARPTGSLRPDARSSERPARPPSLRPTGPIAERPTAPLSVLARAAIPIELSGLDLAQTGELLASVFGRVPHIDALAHHLFRLSDGTPGVLMQLSQHLVERGVIRYAAGAFTLPATLSPDDLPASLAESLRERTGQLSAGARKLLGVFLLLSGRGLSLEELIRVQADTPAAATFDELDELLRERLVSGDAEQYRLAHASLASLLDPGLDQAERRATYRRLAELYRRRPLQTFVSILDLLAAGDDDEALELIHEFLIAVENMSADEVAATLREMPSNWRQALSELLLRCRAERPARDVFAVAMLRAAILAGEGEFEPDTLSTVLAQTQRDSGLDLYLTLDPSLSPEERLRIALETAQRRYDALGEPLRALSPIEAIEQLGRAVAYGVAMIGGGLDGGPYRMLPSLLPFAPLSPALATLERVVAASRAMDSGRYQDSLPNNEHLITLLQHPDKVGLDPLLCRFIRLGSLAARAMAHAHYGHPEGLAHGDELSEDPAFSVMECYLRMLYALNRGDLEGAADLRHEAELQALRDGRKQMIPGVHLPIECQLLARLGDLDGVRVLLPQLQRMAQLSEGWRLFSHWAEGRYRLMRGEPAAALRALSRALSTAVPGDHAYFCLTASTYVDALLACGRAADALAAGQVLLQAAEARQIGPEVHHLHRSLALALSSHARHPEAARHADTAIAILTERGATGLAMGGGLETRAIVAAASGDRDALRLHALRCQRFYGESGHATLAAHLANVVQRWTPTDAPAAAPDVPVPDSSSAKTMLQRRDQSDQSDVLNSDRDVDGRKR